MYISTEHSSITTNPHQQQTHSVTNRPLHYRQTPSNPKDTHQNLPPQHLLQGSHFGLSPRQLEPKLVSLVFHVSQGALQFRNAISSLLTVSPRSHGVTLSFDGCHGFLIARILFEGACFALRTTGAGYFRG